MVNYIVSGLERSGTSMMMQILYRGGAPVAFDDKRKPDYHNPKGYFELEGGKIINKLMEGSFPIEKYDGKFIKVTAYGLRFLPRRDYKIIYMTRNIDEIIDSMEKMCGPINREEEKPLLEKLNRLTIRLMDEREDMTYIIVRYNDVIRNPRKEIERVNEFLGGMLDVDEAVKAVDKKLYRNVREVRP
ncbi:MAG TPA: nucleotide pyrophosphatase [Thermoplasmatales archaeon]|nr:sulfotransferase domain-containing protein [Thermoplasmata archaeon]HHF58657.1 nucleotide pyrophosphatase [Thermoplasmatales archaeon]